MSDLAGIHGRPLQFHHIVESFVTVFNSVASCERSFLKLKFAKKYLRSNLSQKRLTRLAGLSIERDEMEEIRFDSVIRDVASLQARKCNGLNSSKDFKSLKRMSKVSRLPRTLGQF